MKLLFLEGYMTLYPVTIQIKVRRWYNAVTEIDVSVYPECYSGYFPKKVKLMAKVWKQWNNFRGLTDGNIAVKDLWSIKHYDWSAFMFSFRKLTNLFLRDQK